MESESSQVEGGGLFHVKPYPILSFPNPVKLIMPTSYSPNAETSSVKEEQGDGSVEKSAPHGSSLMLMELRRSRGARDVLFPLLSVGLYHVCPVRR